MNTLNDYEEKEPEWLLNGWIPKYQITVMCGDGGSGKTSVWCHIAGKLSCGAYTIFEREIDLAGMPNPKPQKVMFFSSEDSVEYTLKGRLVKNNVHIPNVMTTMRILALVAKGSDPCFFLLLFSVMSLSVLLSSNF